MKKEFVQKHAMLLLDAMNDFLTAEIIAGNVDTIPREYLNLGHALEDFKKYVKQVAPQEQA